METEEILAAIQKAAETIATPNRAAWLSAGAALVAVAVAVVVAVMQIRIAKKQNEITKEQTEISKKQADISDKQNKIVLFEKRVRVYEEISKVVTCGEVLEIKAAQNLPIKIVFHYIIQYFGYKIIEDREHPWIMPGSVLLPQQSQLLIKQAAFLFPQISAHDIEDICSKFSGFLIEFTFEVANNPDIAIKNFSNQSKATFISASKNFKEKYFSYIVECLHL